MTPHGTHCEQPTGNTKKVIPAGADKYLETFVKELEEFMRIGDTRGSCTI